ncbi:zinc permease [Kineobactrum sediminis]|uniref:Zinc permease n=1 Tax=Kineobactrum sediminis TaxID=1905677 RepID=A0A2N5XZ95_9GAMM|nr:zinc permease [Kineobactrum sediminis]PLW81465.1 zinc permease [Kineobactrum sediminis]
MVLAFYFGVIASVALVIGGIAGTFWHPRRQITGVLLAFASGTLISALAFELFPQAVEAGGLVRSTVGLISGAAVFVVFNTWLDRKVAPAAATGDKAIETKVIREGAHRGMGFALLASVTLDGMPENLALGASLSYEANLTLLMAIFASNFPESMVGAISMRQGGQKRSTVIIIWSGAALVLTLMVVLGNLTSAATSDNQLAFLLAFAGGAVIASLADTLMPEAFERGRPFNAFATAAGFVVSFVLAFG